MQDFSHRLVRAGLKNSNFYMILRVAAHSAAHTTVREQAVAGFNAGFFGKLKIMRIVLGADHAGYELKQKLLAYVQELGHEVVDVGTNSTAAVDYPDFAEKVGLAIREAVADRGILICGSGVGASVAVNKMKGVRAGLCHDCYSAHQGVEHDAMNVLVLGSRVIGPELARDLVKVYLGAVFTQEERHVRRLGKVKAIEEKYG